MPSGIYEVERWQIWLVAGTGIIAAKISTVRAASLLSERAR
jgi:hypothetical protein